ncbi:MAG: mechanosensitive ion channel family protein [Desulfobacterales bacterium]|nr:mechanosensitive ion channel family protein [Desulfobacterales bacterium]
MDGQVSRFQELGRLMQDHGLEMITALIILIVGLFVTKWAVKALKELLGKFMKNTATISIVSNSVGVFMLGLVITASAMEIGAKPGPMVALMMIIVLVAIGIIVIFRPLIPTLPFKVGNTVKAGNLLGKVEATTVLNTRLRTFDGKTFFVPNRQILDDIVINYHFTKTRRVKIDVTIRYDQDLMKAKQVLEALMIEDARILPKPNPQVYVLELGPNGVRLGGRCWVNNLKFWVTQCEMLEKTKLRFDAEGIEFAYSQLDINHRRVGDEWAEDLAVENEMPGE